MRILITGGLGDTAKPLIEVLRKVNHQILILDIVGHNPYWADKDITVVTGDICEIHSVCKDLARVDAIIHLAVNTGDPADAALSFQTNIFGTYSVLTYALKSGVKKVLLASSAPVHMPDAWEGDSPCSPGEDFTYDLTKKLQEITAKNFAQTHLMNIMVLRLGHIVDGANDTDLHGKPLSQLKYCRGGWVCKNDVAMAFLKAVEAGFEGFHLLNIIGSHQAEINFDLSVSKDIIGFECKERFLHYDIV